MKKSAGDISSPDPSVVTTPLPTYCLVTPARNEADFIALTLQSVVRQTILPLKWVIVSDGSTDGTDEIVTQYVDLYEWIELVRMPLRVERHFAGKVLAFNAGFERVKASNCDLIGSLDADISFDENYFSFLLVYRNIPFLSGYGFIAQILFCRTV